LPDDLVFYENYLGQTDATFTLNFSTGAAKMLAQYYNICRFGKQGYGEIIGAMEKNARFLGDQLKAGGRFELIFLRRAITLAPALIVLGVGLNPTNALVMSQVVLSFGIPFALVPLMLIARRRDVMGPLANPGWLTVIAGIVGALIIALNVFLLQQVFFG
ncbi:MAG: divalent metal cation transporter, partial [Actinobacteria bacterium]